MACTFILYVVVVTYTKKDQKGNLGCFLNVMESHHNIPEGKIIERKTAKRRISTIFNHAYTRVLSEKFGLTYANHLIMSLKRYSITSFFPEFEARCHSEEPHSKKKCKKSLLLVPP